VGFRLTSPLDDETEAVVTQVVDCALEVHKQLGPGLLESIYSEAFALELDHRKLRFERGDQSRSTIATSR
jgi:GxxExxY protein